MKNHILFILFIFTGCTLRMKVPGIYSGSEKYSTVELVNDSIFSYRYKFEFAYEYSQGFWKKGLKNEIILNSNIQNRTLPLRIQTSNLNIDKDDDLFLTVSINIPEKEKRYYHCSIFINLRFK